MKGFFFKTWIPRLQLHDLQLLKAFEVLQLDSHLPTQLRAATALGGPPGRRPALVSPGASARLSARLKSYFKRLSPEVRGVTIHKSDRATGRGDESSRRS